MYVKKWFAKKSLTVSQYRAASTVNFEFEIIKETEKAVNGYFDTDFGMIWSWIPKSCLQENSDLEIGMNYYIEILAKAKELGVKGIRAGMKLVTIKAKALEQNIEL